MNNYDVIIGVDPGITGGISIIETNKKPHIYKIPILKRKVNKKNKSFYDRDGISNIFRNYIGKKVLLVQEKVSAMPGQGVTSSFNFGMSSECTLAIAAALQFEYIQIRPSEWKKHYNSLETKEIKKHRENMKKLKDDIKNMKKQNNKYLNEYNKSKIEKDFTPIYENNIIKIKKNKKEIEKIKRIIKKESKKAARNLASKKYLSLADNFKLVKHDGLAESLLIALYGKELYNKK